MSWRRRGFAPSRGKAAPEKGSSARTPNEITCEKAPAERMEIRPGPERLAGARPLWEGTAPPDPSMLHDGVHL